MVEVMDIAYAYAIFRIDRKKRHQYTGSPLLPYIFPVIFISLPYVFCHTHPDILEDILILYDK